jgi:hypothetical protein
MGNGSRLDFKLLGSPVDLGVLLDNQCLSLVLINRVQAHSQVSETAARGLPWLSINSAGATRIPRGV